MNHLITSDTRNNWIEKLQAVKTRLSMWSDNYAVETGVPKQSIDANLEADLDRIIGQLLGLPTEITRTKLNPEEINFCIQQGKRFRDLERKFLHYTEQEALINSEQEFEDYTYQLTKFKAEQQ